MDKDKFTIQLDAGELFCVAGVMGLSRLPLPGDPFRGYLVEEIQTEIDTGHQSLIQRGLLQESSPVNLQVESLLIAVVKGIASPDSSLVIKKIEKSGMGEFAAYYSGELRLVLERQNMEYRVTVYSDEGFVKEAVQTWMNIPQQLGDADAFTLTTKIKLDALLNSAWQYPKQMAKDLREAGLNKKDSQHTTDTLTQINYGIVVTRTIWEGGAAKVVDQILLLGNSIMLWSNDGNSFTEPTFTMRSIQPSDIVSMLERSFL